MAEPELPISALFALIGDIERALEGQAVSSVEPVVLKAQALFAESKARSGVVTDFSYEGEYCTATVSLNGRLEGSGTSRVQAKALSYALEDLAVKVRNGG